MPFGLSVLAPARLKARHQRQRHAFHAKPATTKMCRRQWRETSSFGTRRLVCCQRLRLHLYESIYHDRHLFEILVVPFALRRSVRRSKKSGDQEIKEGNLPPLLPRKKGDSPGDVPGRTRGENGSLKPTRKALRA
jgi:hypothetical protein